MTSSNSTPTLSRDQAVRDVVTAVGTAWAAGDVDAFAALYAPDATVVLPGGAYLQGREAIHAFTAAGFAGPLRGSTTANNDVQVRMITDDVADGRISEAYFRRSIVWLTGSRLAGTMLAQALLVPGALWIVAIAQRL